MKGIDVSSNQGSIDFVKVKDSGVEIVYIKATEGTSYINPLLVEQYNGAKSVGLMVGFYHFLRDNDPLLEANHFLSAIEGLVPDCKYVIDVELELDQSVSTISSNVREFADYLISQSKEPCVYAGDYFYRDNLNSTVKDLPLWVANYGANIMANCYNGLQHTETGRLEGINGNVDLDNFDSGILLKTANITLVTEKLSATKIEEVRKVKFLIVVGNSVDKRAAEYLADSLNCPVIDAGLPFDYSVVETPIGVGGTPTTNGQVEWSSYVKTIIVGSDRYDTAQKVLDFIKNKSV